MIESFRQVARELIADGAEVLIPGCMVMTSAMRIASGCEEEYSNGLTEVDGVPVVDVVGAASKLAEVLVSLKKGGSTGISRKGFYGRPTPEALGWPRPYFSTTGRASGPTDRSFSGGDGREVL